MHEQAGRPRIAAEEALPSIAQAGSAERDKGDRLVGRVVQHQGGFLSRPAAEFSRARAVFDVAAKEMKQRKVGFHPFDIVTTRWSAGIEAGRVDAIPE